MLYNINISPTDYQADRWSKHLGLQKHVSVACGLRLVGYLTATPNSVRWLLRQHARLPSWPQQRHGALSKSRSGGFSREAFGWRSVHSFSEARLCFNGSMVDLSHERYLQWQQHKAPGAQKHLMPEEPFFPRAQNRNNNAAKTCGGVIWCCCHCLRYTPQLCAAF